LNDDFILEEEYLGLKKFGYQEV